MNHRTRKATHRGEGRLLELYRPVRSGRGWRQVGGGELYIDDKITTSPVFKAEPIVYR
jgi:hypothetical protein